jgi:hypothetical protein
MQVAAASYPRHSGVVLPSALERAGCASRDAAEIVAWLRRSHRRLPTELLSLELAEPRVILSSWIVGQRTRGSLERLLCAPDGKSNRTFGDYLAAPWLGIHGLVDLLAAREEQEHEASRAADVAPGFAPEPIEVISAPGLEAPSRVLRRGGANVRVAPERVASAEALVTGAVDCVRNWGLCTIDAVVSRLRALTDQPLGMTEAARILGTLPGFRWLDRDSGWFTVATSNSRPRAALRKIFAVTERVLLRDLRAALSKQAEVFATAPADVVETYLAEIAGCEIWDGWVSVRTAGPAEPLGRDERTIVAMVADHAAEIAVRSLRVRAKRLGLSARTVLRVLRTSPLVVERGGRLRLVGQPRPEFASLYSVTLSSDGVVSSVAGVVPNTSFAAGSVPSATQPIVLSAR